MITFANFYDNIDVLNKTVYATNYSAAFDLMSIEDDYEMSPSEVKLFSTGLRIASYAATLDVIPFVMITSRSGQAFKRKLIVLNAPAIIDCDYKDEIKVMLMNVGKEPVIVSKYERIAQALIMLSDRRSNILLSGKDRNGGFGSTGF